MRFLAIIGFLWVSGADSLLEAGTVNYSNQVAQTFGFSQISEVSAQSTYLGGEFYPWSSNATTLRTFRGLDQYDTLEFSPGTSLTLGARSMGGGSTTSSSATTRLSMKISSATMEEIFGFRLRLEGIAVLAENTVSSDAQASIQAMLDLSFFGSNGTWGTSKNLSLSPITLSAPGLNRWRMEWNQADLKTFLQDSAFNPSTMKITELTLQFTPLFSTTAFDQASADLFVNQFQVAVIPEPGTSNLLLLGLLSLFRGRRSPTTA